MISPSGRLAELGLSPKKALGQHFLHDRAIVQRICDAAAISPDALVIEVGPGLGILTQALADRAGSVVALEMDKELASALGAAMPDNVEVHNVDALDFDPTSLGAAEYRLVSNLPYNAAAAILRHFLDSSTPPRTCTFMVQREVAKRMVARPPEMNILAVAMQFHGSPRIVFNVGRGAFTPPPRVDSSVVHIPVQRRCEITQRQLDQFFELVRAGFGTRRKQLKNSLKNYGMDAALVNQILRRATVDPTVRPQELDIDEWITIFEAWRALDPGDHS